MERFLRLPAERRAQVFQQASAESGYSESRLRHLVAAGELQNAGKKGAPRIRRSDLPKKAAGVNVFDATAAARRTA